MQLTITVVKENDDLYRASFTDPEDPFGPPVAEVIASTANRAMLNLVEELDISDSVEEEEN